MSITTKKKRFYTMLKQLDCDCFKIKGEKRKPIVFHKGLNTVLGTSFADNSIGKSTLLFAIDFCFGGKSYLDQKFPDHLKKQTFKYVFEFENIEYYFERDTTTPNEVWKSDSNFNKIEKIELDEFKSFLFNQYKIEIPYLTLREIVGVYVRIFNLDTCSVDTPLQIVKNIPQNEAINQFIKLFGLYDSLKNLNELIKDNTDKKNAYNKARKLNFIPNAISSKKQYKEYQTKLEGYKRELSEFTLSQDKDLITIDIENTNKAFYIKQSLKKLYREKKSLLSKKAQIDMELVEINKDNTDDYKDLLEFFPNVDITRIALVDNYHKKLNCIIDEEMKAEADSLKQTIEIIISQIKDLEDKLRKLNIPVSISLDFLKKYSNKEGQIKSIEKQLEAFDQSKKLEQDLKDAKNALKENEKSILERIEKSVNEQLEIYNNYVCSGEKTNPRLSLPDGSHYTLETYTDEGAGTAYKNLIIFDLSVLRLTSLPILIHDTNLFKNIGDEPLEQIFKLYESESKGTLSEKQIFVAFDKESSFSKDLQEILHKTAVITLGKNGNELFGYSWA